MTLHLISAILTIICLFFLGMALGSEDNEAPALFFLAVIVLIAFSMSTGRNAHYQSPKIEDVNDGKAELCTEKLIRESGDTLIIYSIKWKK